MCVPYICYTFHPDYTQFHPSGTTPNPPTIFRIVIIFSAFMFSQKETQERWRIFWEQFIQMVKNDVLYL